MLGRLIGDVHKGVDSAAWDTHDIALASLEALVIDLEEIATLKDAENFCLAVAMEWRAEAGSVDCLKQQSARHR